MMALGSLRVGRCLRDVERRCCGGHGAVVTSIGVPCAGSLHSAAAVHSALTQELAARWARKRGNVAKSVAMGDRFIAITKRDLLAAVLSDPTMKAAAPIQVTDTPRTPSARAVTAARAARAAISTDQDAESAKKSNVKANVSTFADLTTEICGQRFHTSTQLLKQHYELLDPDIDTVSRQQVSQAEREEAFRHFVPRFQHLADKANFNTLRQEDMDDLFSPKNKWSHGLRVSVDKSKYRYVQFWTRGLMRPDRSWRDDAWSLSLEYFGKSEEKPAIGYRRCLVASRVDQRSLYLKIFKDVDHDILEMLLPKIRLQMSDFDRLLMALSMSFFGLAALGRMALTVDFHALGAATFGVLGTAGFLGFRAFSHVNNAKNKYLANHSRTLYYQNVTSNRGAISLLADRAEEEEFKEVLLAYFVLLNSESPLPSSQLGVRAERWIKHHFDVATQFDHRDATAKLQRLCLLSVSDPTRMRAVPLSKAVGILQHLVNSKAFYNYDVVEEDPVIPEGAAHRRNGPA